MGDRPPLESDWPASWPTGAPATASPSAGDPARPAPASRTPLPVVLRIPHEPCPNAGAFWAQLRGCVLELLMLAALAPVLGLFLGLNGRLEDPSVWSLPADLPTENGDPLAPTRTAARDAIPGARSIVPIRPAPVEWATDVPAAIGPAIPTAAPGALPILDQSVAPAVDPVTPPRPFPAPVLEPARRRPGFPVLTPGGKP